MSDAASSLTPDLGAGTPTGPAPVAPMTPRPVFEPGRPRPLTEDQVKTWKERVTRAWVKAEQFHKQFDRGLARYAKAKVDTAQTDVNALMDYRHVEGKKAQLFHRTPEVSLVPVDPTDQTIPGALLPLREKFLNFELGPKAANAKRALHKTLVETLASSGWMVVKLGYEQRGLPDPITGQAIPIWDRRFISAVSGKKLLVPDDFTDSSDYDAAPWLAVKGTVPVSQARKMGWQLPADFNGSASRDEAVYDHNVTPETTGDPLCQYTEVWYRLSIFDDTVFHPELFGCLILVEGMDTPASSVDSPYQSLTPEGQLTDDSMLGNPIHVGTLRDLPDSAYVPADLVVGEQLTTELNKFRTDLIRNRRARKPITFFDTGGMDQTTIDKVEKNEGPIGLPAGSLAAGKDTLMVVVNPGTEPRDNFTAQEVIERDYEQALGMSANQTGQFAKTKRTATEVRTVQGNSSARAETERDRIRDYFTALVRKFDAIVQRTATPAAVAKVLGAQGAALWQQWQALPGTYAYDILPDAGRYVDAAQYQSSVVDLYNLTRKDPRVNTEELLTMVARAFHRDPGTFIAPAPPKEPEPIKLALSFNGQDVSLPATGRLLLDLLTESGVQLSPDTVALLGQQHAAMGASAVPGGAPMPPATSDMHGGGPERMEPVNQHQTERTGGITGVGR